MALKKVDTPIISTQPSRAAAHVEKEVEKASKPLVKEARLNVRIDAEKHEKFWRACSRNESDMTTEILKFIDEYNAKHAAKNSQ